MKLRVDLGHNEEIRVTKTFSFIYSSIINPTVEGNRAKELNSVNMLTEKSFLIFLFGISAVYCDLEVARYTLGGFPINSASFALFQDFPAP